MKKRRYQSLYLAALIAALGAMPSYGAVGPGQTDGSLPAGVTQEQWDKLNDQTIEFDELPDLVRYFNPSMQNTVDSINDSIGNVQYIHDEMKRYISDLEDDAKELKDSGAIATPEGMQQYTILNMTVKGMKTSSETMGRTIALMNRSDSSINSNITYAAKNYTYYANQVMIGYNSALANRELLQKVVDISTAALDAQSLSNQLGMGTEANLLSAKKEVLSAQSSLLNINNTIDSLRRSLCLMTGYSGDSTPTIGSIPELNLTDGLALDLEADTAKAIGNNYSLISLRRGASNGSTTGKDSKAASVSEGEQSVAISMESFYQAVMQAKSAYDAACTTYEKAVLEKGKADRSFQLGMLSKISSLQSQMAFLQAEATKQSAYNTLYQAYDTYQWAVNGIIMTSAQ